MTEHRIGIIGTGRIAKRFVEECKAVEGAEVTAVYNPHEGSANQFLTKQGLADCRALTELEQLWELADVVYIAAPHELHYRYAKESILHNKHVLCEKPFTLCKAQAEELYTRAKDKELVLYEGIKTAYCPGFLKLHDVVRSGVIGQAKYIDACFTKLEKKENRELTDSVYGGSFTELGSYCLLPIIKLLGCEYEEVQFDSIHGDNGLDLFTRATFRFRDGLATATCGLGVKSEGRLLVAGTKGYIVVEAPWWKTEYFEVHYEDAAKIEKYTEKFLGDGLRYEISDFLSNIVGNNKNECKLTEMESIAISGVMEKFMEHEGR